MPGPSSVTRISTTPSFRRASMTTRVPAGVYLAALPRRLRTICSTYVRLARDDGQIGSEPSLDADGRQLGRLVRDDPLDQPPRLEWLGLDHEPAAFRAAQDEQVLDQAVESLRFGSRRPRAGARVRRGSSARPGRARIWVSPRIVVIGVRSSWLMTSMNASRNSPARRSSIEQLIALVLDETTLGDVLARADHRDRPARFVAEHAAGAMGPMDRSVRPDDPEIEREWRRSPSRAAWMPLRNRSRSSGWIRSRYASNCRRLGRGLQAVLAEDRLRPRQRAVLDVPLPEAGARCCQHDLEPGVASLDLLGERCDLVQRIDQPVARGAPRGHEHHGPGRCDRRRRPGGRARDGWPRSGPRPGRTTR